MADNDSGNKVLWFVGGAAIGATVALLCAPVSGAEVRKKLKRGAEDGRESLAESGRDMIERGRELYERGREIVDEAAEMFERGRKLMDDAPRENA
jgi:gas vesicle protein